MCPPGRDAPAESGGPTDPVEAVRNAYPPLLRAARRLAAPPEAEDLVQEAFVETLSRYPEFRGLDHPLGYLMTVLYRAAFRKRRLSGREVPLDAADVLARLEPDRDAPAAIDEALASLGSKQRACLVLRYLYDLTDEEIAATLGCRPSTVRSQIARGLANARTRIEVTDD